MNIANPILAHLSHDAVSQRAALALIAGKMSTFEWQIADDICDADPMFYRLWGFSPGPIRGEEVFARVHPDDIAGLGSAVQRTLEADVDYDHAFRVIRPDGRTIWMGGRGRVVERDAEGRAMRLLGLNWDMTHAKEQEDRLKNLAREMNHRVNNAFALINSLVMLGRDGASDLDSFTNFLTSQIHALADAHQLAANFVLHHSDDCERIALSTVLDKVLRVWRTGPLSGSIEVDCDCQATLDPQDIAAFSMILYELATNAAKHSVLGAHAGRLTVRVTPASDGRYRFVWQETLTSPRSSHGDTDPGFGSMVIDHCQSQLNATQTERRMDSTGFRFAMDFTASNAKQATVGPG